MVRKMTRRREEDVDVGIQGGWTGRERKREQQRRIGVFAWGAMARQLGGGGGR